MRTQIVTGNSTDEAKKQCPWANIFQRTEDYKETNNWICSSFKKE